MAQLARLRLLLGSAVIPAISIALVLLFIAYAIIGPKGVLAWGNYSRQVQERQAELRILKAQQAALANRVKLLDPRRADRDMVEELVRRDLGVTHPDEIVIPTR
jgi:cell division protein FtsB